MMYIQRCTERNKCWSVPVVNNRAQPNSSKVDQSHSAFSSVADTRVKGSRWQAKIYLCYAMTGNAPTQHLVRTCRVAHTPAHRQSGVLKRAHGVEVAIRRAHLHLKISVTLHHTTTRDRGVCTPTHQPSGHKMSQTISHDPPKCLRQEQMNSAVDVCMCESICDNIANSLVQMTRPQSPRLGLYQCLCTC